MAGWNTNSPISDTINVRTRTHVGLGHTASYQSSGMPFVHTSDADFTIDFEFVTRAITITSSDAGATIDFGDEDNTTFTIPQQSAVRLEIKCKQINVVTSGATVSIVAELTGIEANQMKQQNQADLGTVDGGGE